MATVKIGDYSLTMKIGMCFKEAFFKDFESSIGRNLTQEEKDCFTIDLCRESFDYITRDIRGRLKPAEDWVAIMDANIKYHGDSQEIINNFSNWLADNGFCEEEIEAFIEKEE